MAYVYNLNNSCPRRDFLVAWRSGKSCCPVCCSQNRATYSRNGLHQHYRTMHKTLEFNDMTVKEGVGALRGYAASETWQNLLTLSELRNKSGLENYYQIFTVEGDGERMDLVCSNDKEAAKLFGLYLDHKVSLPKLEDSGEGMKVNVWNRSMSRTYQLWRSHEKIYAEAIYFKTVIEEACRVLQIESDGHTVFMKECVGRLLEELEMMLYFGIHKGLNHPKSPKISSKIIYVLSNLGLIFPCKKMAQQKKGIELVHELKDYEDPSSWCAKQSGNVPVMVVDGNMVYVTVGSKILFTGDIKSIGEATVGYLASFYLLDFDYPKSCEIGLNMLQTIIFEDQRVPKDIAVTFKHILKSFTLFKASA